MDAALRNLVRERASNRCEYCRIRQEDEPFYRFHIEHIIPRQHGGTNEPDNLALACHYCNLHKGPNLATIDPVSSEIIVLFNPRRQTWNEHFTSNGGHVVGLTPTGRASVYLLQMNAISRQKLRSEA